MVFFKFNNQPVRMAVSAAILFLGLILSVSAQQPAVTPRTALKHYVEKPDPSFRWEVKDSLKVGPLMVYNLLLTSQTWRNIVWTHQLTVLVPDAPAYDGALLYITGGSIEKGLPKWNTGLDRHLRVARYVAEKNQAVVAVLRQTPNQPLYGGKKEDELISMTLHSYKQDGDYEWPLLFPMVKSAVRAMDAVQQFTGSRLAGVERFAVTGLSKRGWTTWLTGAIDTRVVAIAPMVIDVLNMPVSLQYQIETWGDYSVEIQDYVKLGIPQSTSTAHGREITAMVDPYSYRKSLTMPKMLFMGTNDPYWVVDNVKNYIDSIPGENRIHYVPNAGHDLGDGEQAMQALSAFFGASLRGTVLPPSDWTWIPKRGKVKLRVRADRSSLRDVIVWTASSTDRDFRDERWVSKSLGIRRKGNVRLTLPLPEEGHWAYYVDLQYDDPDGGSYTQSTRVFIVDHNGIL